MCIYIYIYTCVDIYTRVTAQPAASAPGPSRAPTGRARLIQRDPLQREIPYTETSHTYLYTYIYIYIYMYMYMYIYIYMYMYVYMCVYIYIYICMYARRSTAPGPPAARPPAASRPKWLPVGRCTIYIYIYVFIYIYIYI